MLHDRSSDGQYWVRAALDALAAVGRSIASAPPPDDESLRE